MLDPVQVYTAMDVLDANIIKGMLLSHGIEVEVHGEYLQGAFGELPVINMMSLHVAAQDEARAMQLIKDYQDGIQPVSEQELLDAALRESREE